MKAPHSSVVAAAGPVAVNLALAVAFGSAAVAHAQEVRINEIMAANATIEPDNVDFDDYSDWIELHNPTGTAVSLSDYFLSDDPSEPLKWHIPDGAVVPAHGFLVIRADGFDAGPGETHVREFSPWDSFQTQRYHANFKLSADGESVVLARTSGPLQTFDYLVGGSTWRYSDHGESPGDGWQQPAFDDSGWSSGISQFGYGEGDESTVIDYGPSSNDKFVTTYFRTSFEVGDPARIVELDCRAMVDDGAVFYLNGTEVARLRMPGGPVGNDTLADSGPEDRFEPVAIPRGALRAGTNVLAVEVHQTSPSSSDVSFDLQLSGLEVSGDPVVVDSIDFGLQIDDVSLGRDPADDGSWVWFGEPTPGRANTTIPTLERLPSTDVVVSPAGGFHAGPVAVTLATGSPDATIRFTLDGSVPGSSSPAYSGPVTVSSTTVLRARAFEDGTIPGTIATHTFLIDEPQRPLPVVAFTVAPETFFDPAIGIYDNVHKGREAPCTIEYYAADRTPAFQVNAGAKIGGENIWRFAQKPLNIALRGKYGDDLIQYRIFPDEPLGTFDAIGFRNGGDNWPNAMLRDAMAPSIVRGQMDNDVAAYRPCVLYLNGRYWGIHNVRGRLGDRYFFNRYQIQPGGYDLLVKEHTINGTELVVNEGTADAYLAFEEFVTSHDLSVPANYEAAVARMDLDSFMDYAAMVDFVHESSWHHNQEFWRERRDGAKWRWTINDIDRGFNHSNVASSLIDDLESRHPVFEAMVANDGFRERFAQRYAAHLASTFHPDRIADIINGLAAEVDPEIQRHIDRWKASGGIQSVSSRRAELDEIVEFAAERAGYVFDDMAGHLGISAATADLVVQSAPAGAGRLLVDGVPVLPEYTNRVKLYRNIAFDVTAEPLPGFRFVGWSTGETTATITRTLGGNASVTANFEPSGESVLPPVIASPMTLTAAGSPYTSEADVTVQPGVTLAIEAGVVVRMAAGSSLHVQGSLDVAGTAGAPVTFEPRPGAPTWGAIGFTGATGVSTLAHVRLVGATFSRIDPVNLKAAVSALNSEIVLDHVDIAAPLPVFARGGSTTVRASLIHPEFTGDGVNIKGGAGLVEDCTFIGNSEVDTDAIDFDDVAGGIIRGNRIYAFQGPNSDAIDVGEGCVDLLVTGNRIFHCSDKGVSVGQGSSVRIEKNLVVGCALGVGIKDAGSVAEIDGNTFVQNAVGVAVYEKNFGKGGGRANVVNCIFSRSKDADVTVDALSTIDVRWSLSDTASLPGDGNLLADPAFVEPAVYDFSIAAGSPAADAGDPAHPTDPDGSRVDIGAEYVYDPDDFPFHVPHVVVINEVLAHSSGDNGDWIELHNSGPTPFDVGGWFLSDDPSELRKYRIADGTVIPARGFLVLTEGGNFGTDSGDPGSLVPFALSENGETVCLLGPGGGLQLDYVEEESFGPSASDVSKGRFYKASSKTFNFVAMETATPGAPNSAPLVGPVVISEIMFHPDNGDAEFLELLNIGDAEVTLFETDAGEPWRMTQGIEFSFPADPPVTLAPGERCLLVRNEAAFRSVFTVPAGTQVFQWDSGGLNNGGEKVELSRPGDVDGDGIRQFIRIDRVDYEDAAPWPAEPDRGRASLTRIREAGYGNDFANWTAAEPTPGESGFERWARESGVAAENAGPFDDGDHDGKPNLVEYATGGDPTVPDGPVVPEVAIGRDGVTVRFPAAARPELSVRVQCSTDLGPGRWTDLEAAAVVPAGDGAGLVLEATAPRTGPRLFFRLVIEP